MRSGAPICEAVQGMRAKNGSKKIENACPGNEWQLF